MADEIDDLLDRALGSYSAGEPLDGLERRVLARVRGNKRREVHWNWMAVVACLVVLVGGASWTWVETAPSRSRLSRVAVVEKNSGGLGASGPTTRANPIVSVHRLSRDREEAVARRHKMQLTREEVLLARFVAADPEQAAKQFASLNEYVQRDVTVAPLAVEPIKIEEIER